MSLAMGQALDLLTSEANDDGEIVSFFDASFTASSNRLLHDIYVDGNVTPFVRLLLFISRYSTGYLKPEVILKESFVLEETGMSRSSFYKAKKELLESGKITIAHTKGGNCVYRLAPDLQCLKGATSAQERARRRWGSAAGDPIGPRLETPHVHKENKDNLDQHHTIPKNQNEPKSKATDDASLHMKLNVHPSRLPSSVFSVTGQPVKKTTPKPSKITTESTRVTKFNVPELTESQLYWADRLRRHAVEGRIAETLVKTNPSDVIEKALAGLSARKEVINPAGWLVREIKSGGYAPPAPSAAVVADQTRRAVELARAAEKKSVEAERERQNEAANADLAELNQLSSERHTELLETARTRMAWLPRAAEAGPDNPFIRGAMIDLLREIRQRR